MMETVKIGNLEVFIGEKKGKYPSGNSVLIKDQVNLLVDPSLDLHLAGRTSVDGTIDLIINSHAHEDHFAGNYLFPESEILIHRQDMERMQSLDALLDAYEIKECDRERIGMVMTEIFNYRPVNELRTIADGEVIDLGHNRVHVIHAPGHTPGHVMLLFEPDDILFAADLDLTSFGPYYGDVNSSLEDTIQSIEKMRFMANDMYACISSHQAGVVHNDIRGTIDRFYNVIWDRENRLLEFLAEPRTFDEIIDKCIVYRKKIPGLYWQYTAEKNMMSQHVDRLLLQKRITREEDGHLRVN